MKLDCVLTACDMNPVYFSLIPYFIKSWEITHPNIDIIVLLINDTIPDNLKPYQDKIVLFEPLEGVSTAFTSQCVRLFYASLLQSKYQGGVMLSDIDIIPMNSTYYTKNIEKFPDDKFIAYREQATTNGAQELVLCYNTATAKTWGEIFNIKTLDDVRQRLCKLYGEVNYIEGVVNRGWFTDQRCLYFYGKVWNKTSHNLVFLSDKKTEFKRLSRIDNFTFSQVKDDILAGKYVDYHCYRPYDKYKIINDLILLTLKKQMESLQNQT